MKPRMMVASEVNPIKAYTPEEIDTITQEHESNFRDFVNLLFNAYMFHTYESKSLYDFKQFLLKELNPTSLPRGAELIDGAIHSHHGVLNPLHGLAFKIQNGKFIYIFIYPNRTIAVSGDENFICNLKEI